MAAPFDVALGAMAMVGAVAYFASAVARWRASRDRVVPALLLGTLLVVFGIDFLVPEPPLWVLVLRTAAAFAVLAVGVYWLASGRDDGGRTPET